MFISFEGSEGSGKSTQLHLLANFLQELGLKVVVTREPGGTKIGEQVRLCLHSLDNQDMAAAAEALLYSASRAQLVKEVIRPALEAGAIVLSDRFADSTLAYQGYGRRLNLDDLVSITRLATGGLVPDLTFFLDVEVSRGLARRSTGGNELNRMDMQTVAFYERVREGYLALCRGEPERWRIIDANRPPEEVQEDIRRTVQQCLADAT
jgi:dTMP kinase